MAKADFYDIEKQDPLIKKTQRNNLIVRNVKIPKYLNCQVSKLKKRVHNGITPKIAFIPETIYSDITGPIQPSFHKERIH